ncbi:MAG TPA: adenylosuccinate synthetase, partial [Candidatus Cryosericum sp.]|nr:adenylosuccinate synthetase [Candidatus Cryosericum sp.]
MRRVAVVGAQWGDEGKGKVVNYFAKDFEWIVRFAGGANAGHTIYVGDRKYVNHLLPCILPEGSGRGFLGAGMVVDLEQLIAELEVLAADFPGIGARFAVDPEVFLVLPWHKQQDQLMEAMRSSRIGTTGRGIGPAYTDKASREGIKLCHL